MKCQAKLRKNIWIFHVFNRSSCSQVFYKKAVGLPQINYKGFRLSRLTVSFTKYLRKLLRNCFPSWKSHLFKSSSRNKLVSGQLWKKILKNVFAKYHLVLEYNFSLYEAIKNSVPTLLVEYIWKPLIENTLPETKKFIKPFLSFLIEFLWSTLPSMTSDIAKAKSYLLHQKVILFLL